MNVGWNNYHIIKLFKVDQIFWISSGWFLWHFHLDRLYVQYFVWLNHVTRYIYVYRSFKWWIFSSINFLCNHSIPPDSWNLPVQENMYVYMYIRRKSPTRDIKDWLQSSVKVECWGLHDWHPIHLLLIWSWKPIQTWTNWIKNHPPSQPHHTQICTYDNN